MKVLWVTISFSSLLLFHSSLANEYSSCGKTFNPASHFSPANSPPYATPVSNSVNPIYNTLQISPVPTYNPAAPATAPATAIYNPGAPPYGPSAPIYESGPLAYGSGAPVNDLRAPGVVPAISSPDPTALVYGPNYGSNTPILSSFTPAQAPTYGPNAPITQPINQVYGHGAPVSAAVPSYEPRNPVLESYGPPMTYNVNNNFPQPNYQAPPPLDTYSSPTACGNNGKSYLDNTLYRPETSTNPKSRPNFEEQIKYGDNIVSETPNYIEKPRYQEPANSYGYPSIANDASTYPFSTPTRSGPYKSTSYRDPSPYAPGTSPYSSSVPTSFESPKINHASLPSSSYPSSPVKCAPDESSNDTQGLSLPQQGTTSTDQTGNYPAYEKYLQNTSDRKHVPEDKRDHSQKTYEGQIQKEVPGLAQEKLVSHDEPYIEPKPKCNSNTGNYPNYGYPNSDYKSSYDVEALEQLRLQQGSANERPREHYLPYGGLDYDTEASLNPISPYEQVPYGPPIYGPSGYGPEAYGPAYDLPPYIPNPYLPNPYNPYGTPFGPLDPISPNYKPYSSHVGNKKKGRYYDNYHSRDNLLENDGYTHSSCPYNNKFSR